MENQSKPYTFNSIPRLLDMIPHSEKAIAYIKKLSDQLKEEGYEKDSKIVNEHIKIMNGEKIGMATMDKKKKEEFVMYEPWESLGITEEEYIKLENELFDSLF